MDNEYNYLNFQNNTNLKYIIFFKKKIKTLNRKNN